MSKIKTLTVCSGTNRIGVLFLDSSCFADIVFCHKYNVVLLVATSLDFLFEDKYV